MVRHFVPYHYKIEQLRKRGIKIRDKRYNVLVVHVFDFKVLYSITGGSSAAGKHPCIFCAVESKHMECNKLELLEEFQIPCVEELPKRPEVCNMIRSSKSSPWQKSGTFNLFCVQRNNPPSIVPHPLHMKIGILNKIVQALDLVAIAPDKRTNNRDENVCKTLLAASLVCVGARRDVYYSGQLYGKPCTFFIRNIAESCERFFQVSLPEIGIPVFLMHSLAKLDANLRELGILYNRTNYNEYKGFPILSG